MDQVTFSTLVDQICEKNGDLSIEIEKLHDVVKSCEIRDFDWNLYGRYTIYDAIWCGLNGSMCMDADSVSSELITEQKALEVWFYLASLAEFVSNQGSSATSLTYNLIKNVFKRIVMLTTSPQPCTNISLKKSVEMFKHLLHWVYVHNVLLRPLIRSQLGSHLLKTYQSNPALGQRSNDAGNSRAHVSHLLEVLYTVLGGLGGEQTRDPLLRDPAVAELLTDVLMPLHAPNEMIEWRDQIPVVQCYHEQLVRCLVKLVERDVALQTTQLFQQRSANTVLVQTIKLLLKVWPDAYQTNTPKQVLLLHELETLLELATPAELSAVLQPLLTRVVKCIGSDADNIRPAQRALQFFKNDKLLDLMVRKRKVGDSPSAGDVVSEETSEKSNETDSAQSELQRTITDKVLRALLPALYRGGALSWNPTVNKMTALALKNIKNRDEEAFITYSTMLLGSGGGRIDGSPTEQSSGHKATHSGMPPPSLKRLKLGGSIDTQSSEGKESKEEDKGEKSSEKKAMLPPRAVNISNKPVIPRSQVPVPSTNWQQYSASNPPPSTVTGVAPWAVQPQPSRTAEGKSTSSIPKGVLTKLPVQRSSALLQERHSQDQNKNTDATNQSSRQDGFALISRYMLLCYPEIDSEGKAEDKASEWNLAQAAQSPTMLPSLRFHDLVFGSQLGEGAFSVVKYARHITKDKSQSSWPEYAVKIILASKIAEHQYLSSVVREMAVLQVLVHPGVARLVSTFRYKDSAYLVLEYAAKGDLHTYLLNYGKLSHLHTRFVIGEVVAALLSIHELGFSFNDLKPENVLITELGHVKVADFGACRPVTNAAKELLRNSKSLLTQVRNGDWKETAGDSGDLQHLGESVDEQSLEEDGRLEGTPAYLPPEVLSGRAAMNTLEADGWALGCLVHFCVHGKPLFFGDNEEVLDQIHEHHATRSASKVHFADEQQPQEGFPELLQYEDWAAGDFVAQLTDLVPKHRLSVLNAASHDYLTTGVAESHLQEASDKFGTALLPQVMRPLSLHSQEPIPLPMKNKRVDSGADELWARRQFSRLWAPMPAEYALGESDGTSSRVKSTGESSPADLWLAAHPHRFTAVEETEVERTASFLVCK